MYRNRGSRKDRGCKIPDDYSDTEALMMATWNDTDEQVNRRLAPQDQTVLVVDDDPDQLQFLRRIVERAGYRVAISGSATEALGILEHQQCDVIVSDYKMPEMDGFEFLRAVRSGGVDLEGSEIPVIMLTACGDDLEFVALERGADMFCEKYRAESLLVKQIQFLLEM
jgi:CheY-like chemotaxis protein